jgi:uncharacterized membrane protein (UPF0136 family)
MNNAFFIILGMFLLTVALLLLNLKTGLYKRDTSKIMPRALKGFLKGFALTFILDSIIAVIVKLQVDKYVGGLFDFFLWNTMVSLLGGLIFALVRALPVDLSERDKIDRNIVLMYFKSGHLVIVVLSGITVFLFLIYYIVKL